jgi:hypothetical protein
MEEPRLLDGEERRDTSVHPEGHFLWAGTAGKASHKGSTLFWKTLLPRKAIVRKIGGKGHQFEVNGENYDMYDAWYRRLGQDYFDRIGLGLWRMEVEPREKRREDLFLHVLQATDGAVTKMAPAELIEEEGEVGARIQARGGEVTVTFGTTGPVRGRVKIEAGTEDIDLELAREVIDDYEAWRDDPRYGRWMNDPSFRAALTPVDGPQGHRGSKHSGRSSGEGSSPQSSGPGAGGGGLPRKR